MLKELKKMLTNPAMLVLAASAATAVSAASEGSPVPFGSPGEPAYVPVTPAVTFAFGALGVAVGTAVMCGAQRVYDFCQERRSKSLR